VAMDVDLALATFAESHQPARHVKMQWERDDGARDLGMMAGALAQHAPDQVSELVESLKDPHEKLQAFRIAASVADGPQSEEWLQSAEALLPEVRNAQLRELALTDLAVTWSRCSAERAEELTDERGDPGLKAYVLAVRAMRLGGPLEDGPKALLRSANELLGENEKGSARHRACAGYVVARAWQDADRDELLATADALTFEPDPW